MGDLQTTILSVEGYLKRERAYGRHPSHPLEIPLTLAQWEEIVEALKRPSPDAADETEKS